MGFNGLKEFKQREESRRSARTESPFFRLEPGQKVRLRPLVELDDEGDSFDQKNGTANFVNEYVNPVKFWLSVVDTYDDEGASVGKEMVQRFGWYKAINPDPDNNQHNDKTKNWNPKRRFYLPVVVDRLDDTDPTVEVLQLTFGERSYSQNFVDFYEEKGTIMDRWWNFSRNDADARTDGIAAVQYKLTPDDPSKFDNSKYEVPNIDDAPYVNHVPHSEQAEFLQIDATYPKASERSISSTSAEDEDEAW